ncbi:hypothetical protein ACFL16_02985 [Patescibacteria group bacterium]
MLKKIIFPILTIIIGFALIGCDGQTKKELAKDLLLNHTETGQKLQEATEDMLKKKDTAQETLTGARDQFNAKKQELRDRTTEKADQIRTGTKGTQQQLNQAAQGWQKEAQDLKEGLDIFTEEEKRAASNLRALFTSPQETEK